jgi:hypothetical protein
MAIALALALVLLVSVMVSTARAYTTLEQFATDQSSKQSFDAYVSARSALLPPPKVSGGDGAAPSHLDDPLPGNAHATRSRTAWTHAIRDSPREDSRDAQRKVYVADDAVAVLRSVSAGGGAWEAVPVSSDADTYPATISAIRTIIADAYKEGGAHHGARVHKGRPQLARAAIEGLWRQSSNVAGPTPELWRVLACFAAADHGDDAVGRCFHLDVLIHQPIQDGRQLRGPELRARPGRLLFAAGVGVIDGGVLLQPQTEMR